MPEIPLAAVPLLPQHPELPTGCEATALAMLLGWSGLEISKEEVARHLSREPAPFDREGRRLGGDPHRAFLGDPWKTSGLGTFHGVIAGILDNLCPGRALDLTGATLERALTPLSSRTPVVAWCTLDLREPRVTDRWEDLENPGRTIEWTSPEHCVLVVGATPDEIVVHDPHTGTREHWPRALFARRWEQMGRQAVTVGGGPESPPGRMNDAESARSRYPR